MAKETEDGNTKQWEKLRDMRKASGTDLKPEQPRDPDTGKFTIELTKERAADPDAIKAEHDRLVGSTDGAGTVKEPEDDEPAETPIGDKPSEAPPMEAATPKDEKPAVTTAPPGTKEVTIDGQKVFVDAALADAFTEAEKVTDTTAKDAERRRMMDEIREELKSEMPVVKSPADLAAEKALADAEKAEPIPMPAADLQISDPAKFAELLKAHITDQAKREAKAAIDAANASNDAKTRSTAAEAAKQQEDWARKQLTIQFFEKYKILGDEGSRDIAETILQNKITEVINSGVLKKKGATPAEGEAFKSQVFAEVAANATRKIVKVMGAGKTLAPPPEPPPSLASSQPSKSPTQKAKEPEAKPREKYPARSMSAALAARKASREAPAA